MVDMKDLKSFGESRGGSTPPAPTICSRCGKDKEI